MQKSELVLLRHLAEIAPLEDMATPQITNSGEAQVVLEQSKSCTADGSDLICARTHCLDSVDFQAERPGLLVINVELDTAHL